MDRIDEIRARLAAATPGKWEHNEDATVVGVLWTQVVCRLSDRFDDDLANHAANAALITNAPADLAYLLEEVERLRAACEAIYLWHRGIENERTEYVGLCEAEALWQDEEDEELARAIDLVRAALDE